MNKPFSFKQIVLAVGCLLLPLTQAATMAKADYGTEKTRIGATYKADKAACSAFTANAKDICREDAQAKQYVARAELEAAYSGTAKDKNKVLVTKAKSAYSVAKEKCDDFNGNEKDVCIKEAKAVEIKALADAKMGRQVGNAQADAANDKRDADYNVAVEKCDAMTGDAKAACVASAKVRFGRS